MQGEYRAVIALKGLTIESSILACSEMTKIAQFVMPKMSKIIHDFLCEKFHPSISEVHLKYFKLSEVFEIVQGV